VRDQVSHPYSTTGDQATLSYINEDCVTKLNNYLTTRNGILLQKQRVSWSGNSWSFMKTDGSLPYSQQSATCLYSKLVKSSPHSHRVALKIHLRIFSHLFLGLPNSLFP
jgi:hypothetical protein